jgi:hypothetical protein
MEQLRTTDALSFLDAEVYPGWSAMVSTFKRTGTEDASGASSSLVSEAQGRGGFYFCNAMIQLAENVYSDLDLEDYWEHPDNRGWVNLFRHWAGSDMMRKTWAISATTYGARFQVFCQERFGFPKQTKVILGTSIEIKVSDLPEGIKDLPEGIKKNARNKGLNDIEIGLIKDILNHNKDKLPVSVIPFQIEVPRLPGSENGSDAILCFNFGFALIVDGKIGYFRVQNHLRKAGLGRQTLEVLFTDSVIDKNLDLDLSKFLKVPAKAFEVPTEEDKERFQTLYRSVRFTVGLKKNLT